MFADVLLRALAVVKAQLRDRHAAEVIPAYRQRHMLDLVGRQPRGVSAADQRADAGAGDQVNRDVIPLQYPQDADVRAAASHPAAERETNQRALLSVIRHGSPSSLNFLQRTGSVAGRIL